MGSSILTPHHSKHVKTPKLLGTTAPLSSKSDIVG